MKKFSYKDIGKEIGWNFSNMNYDIERKSNFDYYSEVSSHILPTTKILDIGCGSAEKATRFYNSASEIYLTDNEPEMLKKARSNVDNYFKNGKNNFSFKLMNSRDKLDFKDNYFDMVVSRHCGANMQEVYRVLKPGGIFISEDVSFDDCQELKDVFKRGQGYNEQPLYTAIAMDCFKASFSQIKFLKFEEIEYYKTIDDLKYLLTHTPILNSYDEQIDDKILLQYIHTATTSKGIRLVRRLYSFVLIK